jgi:Fe2+ transport system protein B
MAFIKSALEIAMERTKDLKIDPESIKLDKLKKEGRKFASDYLFTINFERDQLGTILKKYSGNSKKGFIEGLVKTFLSNIVLPKNDDSEELLQNIKSGLCEISDKEKEISVMIEQINQFFLQYLENRKQLIEAIKQQYEPRLKQKQQELAEKYGHEVSISPEQDPEFMEILKANLLKMEGQYTESLSGAKGELEKIL